MPEGSAKTSRPVLAMLLGLAATAVMAVCHVAGLDRWLELGTLDLRFRALSTAPITHQVVTVNIDDRSLEELGRWPWPREQLAGVVEVLQRCGARAVALDIIMPEPQETRYVWAQGEVYADDSGLVLGADLPRPVLDDRVLADTLSRYGNTFLPMHVVLQAPPPTPLEATLERAVAAEPNLSLAEARARAAARPSADGDLSPKAVAQAYLRARAMAVLGRHGLEVNLPGDRKLHDGQIVPPLVTLAQAAAHTGFVTVDPDGDGVVRRIPLLVRSGGKVWPQLAFSLAADELAHRRGQPYEVVVDRRGLTVRCGGQAMRTIPLEPGGYMRINWMPPAGERDTHRQVPAGQVGLIWRMLQQRDQSAELRRQWCAELVGMARNLRTPQLNTLWGELTDPADGLYAQRNAALPRRLARQVQRQKAALFDPGSVPPDDGAAEHEAGIEARIDALHEALLAELRDPNGLEFYLTPPAPGSPDGVAAAAPAGGPDPRDRRRAQRLLGLLEEQAGKDRQTARNLEEALRALRPLVAGRLCLVGSTATGAADFVPTPMHPRLPGVEVHANIVNTILSGRFIRRAPLAVNLLLVVLAGAAVSLAAAVKPVWQSGPLTAVLAGGYTAFASAGMFRLWDVWLVIVGPLGAMFFSLLVVTAYRQLTEERAKRHIRGLFAQALSPELVDRLTEDPSLLRLGGEKRVLSCFFSDLAGFTPLSERLGEQGTVRLLNRYFDRMAEVIRGRNGGYLNKFLGDGMFVFFGAPVFQDDHAARALRAALDCQEELSRFNEELRRELDGEVRVASRIGVATGEVMVGNCGSTDKFDYTAIGDTVNLASRLEGANKTFGTRVLVDQATWEAAGERAIVGRCLGKVLVVGKVEPVTVWNPIGRADEVGEGARGAAADFTAAVERFARRDFQAAAEAFGSILKASPGDAAAELYLDLCRRYQSRPPGPDWAGEVQLTQK